MGALAMKDGPAAPGLYCLPGTHSKWIAVSGGRIARFSTFLTGELYDLLMRHSTVGALAENAGTRQDDAFRRGLEAGRTGDRLTNRLFGVRAKVLNGSLDASAVGSYLSGLLIAGELQSARELYGHPGDLTLIADRPLARWYELACRELAIQSRHTDAGEAVVRGYATIAESLAW